ncbi:MAG: hypothetical protein R2755_33465 [Acidimicrobiales bacterium]
MATAVRRWRLMTIVVGCAATAPALTVRSSLTPIDCCTETSELRDTSTIRSTGCRHRFVAVVGRELELGGGVVELGVHVAGEPGIEVAAPLALGLREVADDPAERRGVEGVLGHPGRALRSGAISSSRALTRCSSGSRSPNRP